MGAAALLRAVRSLRGATQLSIIGCDCGRIYDVFDESDPGGEWDLETDDPYEFCVMRSLLKLANASDACTLATVKVNGSLVRLTRDEADRHPKRGKAGRIRRWRGRRTSGYTRRVRPGPASWRRARLARGRFDASVPTLDDHEEQQSSPARFTSVWDGVFRTACFADADQ